MIFAFYGHLDYLHLEINIIGKHALSQSPGAKLQMKNQTDVIVTAGNSRPPQQLSSSARVF